MAAHLMAPPSPVTCGVIHSAARSANILWCGSARSAAVTEDRPPAFSSSLRGSITLWQGEELGLPQVDVPFDRLKDPEAIANWPQTLSRDGARTPMPWQSDAPQFGFSTTEPWLPVGKSHAYLAVDRQDASTDSLLQFTRECLRLRRAHPALRHGSIKVTRADEHTLVWRDYSGNAMFNTLGNLETDPRAGLFFPDFATGSALLLSGTARIVWESSDERSVVFTVRHVAEVADAFARFSEAPVGYSPFNPSE